MTWDELGPLLPHGFHDARLEEMVIDYRGRTAVITLEFWAAEIPNGLAYVLVPELYRRGRVTFWGLLAFAADVPNGEYQTPEASGLWINVAPAGTNLPKHPSWPNEALPEGAFVRSFYFLNDAAFFVHVAAQDVGFEWLTETRLLNQVDTQSLGREASTPTKV